MARRIDDRSDEHLTWLLDCRSANMQASKSLFLIIKTYSDAITSNPRLQEIAQELTGVVFSLWRSVFLSDLTGEIADHVADLEEFLGNLISNNTIAYPQDKNTKEFTFRYYLQNAQLRLSTMAEKMPEIVHRDPAAVRQPGIKTDWAAAQNELTMAITAYGEHLAAHGEHLATIA